jgi:ribonuclease HIII
MAGQITRVAKLDDNAARALEQRLRSDPDTATADWRSVAHALFSVRTGEVTATCYTSGKLVVQGRDPDRWLERHAVPVGGGARSGTGSSRPQKKPRAADDAPALDGPTIGSDETGKGDYFGPLVVAATLVRPDQADALRGAGVADSKTLTDRRATTLAATIRSLIPVAVEVLDPVPYNAEHARTGNINIILAAMHARVIAKLLANHADVSRIVVDRFTVATTLEKALAREVPGPTPTLVQEPKGERHVPVAAASIVARAEFLTGLARCAAVAGVDLHKGAGQPVDVAARRVLAAGGRDLLAKVAKMHFKNTTKVGADR